MSRSWERQVRKNSADLDKKRQKTGQPTVRVGEKRYDEFKGRNMILPFVFIAVAVLYAIVGSIPVSQGQTSPVLYWVTVLAYIGLGLLIFFRKPYLKVANDHIMTTKWNRIRTLYAKDIKSIMVQPGYVVIEKSGKGGNWVFSRFMNRYNTDEMGERLIKFAEQHKIPHERVTKSK